MAKLSYYGEKKRAVLYMEDLLRRIGRMDKLLLIYQMTKQFEIGDKTVEKRLEMMKELNIIEIKDGVIIWIQN